VIGIRLTYSSDSSEKATAAVRAMVSLVRDAVMTSLVVDRVSSELQAAHILRSESLVSQLTSTFASTNLRKKETDLRKIASDFPGASPPQQVVDVGQGGYRYLSPAAQLVGLRSTLAEYEHSVREAERTARVAALKIELFLHANETLRRAGTVNLVPDVVRVLRSEVEAFVKGHSGDEAEQVKLEAQVALARLEFQQDNMRSIQEATVTRRGRGSLTLSLALLAPIAITLGVMFFSLARGVLKGGMQGAPVH